MAKWRKLISGWLVLIIVAEAFGLQSGRNVVNERSAVTEHLEVKNTDQTSSQISYRPSSQPVSDNSPDAAGRRSGMKTEYLTDVDLGNGTREMTISPSPLQFRASDGSWQPIDPRFERSTSQEGTTFVNARNAIEVTANATRAALSLKRDGGVVGWETLELTQLSEGAEIALARPIKVTQSDSATLSADQRTLTYAGSWTLPDLSDEIILGAGAVEHNVVFAAPPPFVRNGVKDRVKSDSPAASVNEKTTLRALLRLPGLTLYADGKPQTGAFETTGALEARDVIDNHSLLTIPPAWVYERAEPANAIAARYRVSPYDATAWLVEMETPLAWWLDPARQYPVVWDPVFFSQHGAMDVADIGACNEYDTGVFVGLGRNSKCGDRRALVRFKNLSSSLFPPGAEIESAWLAIGAFGGVGSNETSSQRGGGWLYTNIMQVNSSWNGSTIDRPGPTTGATLCENLFVGYSQGKESDPALCRIQNGASGIVSNWINGYLTNNGLVIANSDPFCRPAYTGCDLALIPRNASWRRENGNLRGSGFALVIKYHGPQLTSNEPFGYDVPFPTPPAVAPGDVYFEADHDYRLPSYNGSAWTAVAVKGFTDRINPWGQLALNGQFAYSQWAQAGGLPADAQSNVLPTGLPANPYAYAFPISACRDASVQGCSPVSPGTGTDDGSNFVLLRGDTAGRDARIGSLKSNPALKTYVVEAAQSVNITLPPMDPNAGVKYTHTFAISTSHIITAFEVSVPANVNARIAISEGIAGLVAPSANASARLFPPTNNGGGFAKGQTNLIATRDQPIRPNNPLSGGKYGLVVELPGDVTAFETCLRELHCEDSPATPDITPTVRSLDVSLVFQMCPANSIPSNTGCAIVVSNPDWNTTPWIAVGNFRVVSPGGFAYGADCSLQWCSNRFGDDGKEYATLITYGADTSRMVVVVGGPDENHPVQLNWNPGPNPPFLQGRGEWLLTRSAAPGELAAPLLSLWQNFTAASAYPAWNNNLISALNCNRNCAGSFALSESDRKTSANLSIEIDMLNGGGSLQHADYRADIKRPVQTINGPQNQELRLTWEVRADGYQGWLDSPGGDGPLNPTVTSINVIPIDPAPVASMLYRFSANWYAYYNPASGVFDRFRNDNGKIQHVAKLGGAWNYVDMIVLPFGQKPDGDAEGQLCPLGYCADVRAPDDTWAAPKRQWRMPDININQLPQTMLYSRPGELQVFSSDHPENTSDPWRIDSAVVPNDTDVGFSFKTFGANVSIKDMACPDSLNQQLVSVIQGNTKIGMPGMGESPSGASVEATFILCESALHEVGLTFKFPPGIPVGQPPPMWIDMLGGKVTLNPEYARIQVFVGFYIGAPPPETPAQPFKGVGTVTLDTRGLMDLQVTGRVYGMMDAEAHLWVAWNPLDLGIGATGYLPNKNDWLLRGFWYGHAWMGQGWQSKYKWLPNNNLDFHLTASYQAEFKIQKGVLINEYPLVIPPGDVTINVELSFGQFCANDACSSYEWGIKGKVKVFGFSAGAYISLDCLRNKPEVIAGAMLFPPVIMVCTSFILGSDSHILVDQYGGGGPPGEFAQSPPNNPSSRDTVMMNGVPTRINRRTASNPVAPTANEALPAVTAATDSFLLAFGWVRGNPQITLIRPDSAEITAANAGSYGVDVTATSNQVIFGVSSPMVGAWTARITYIGATDDYHLAYFANKAAPKLDFVAPLDATDVVTATTNGTLPQYYRISWNQPNPPANAADLRLSLYYSATQPGGAGALTNTQQYGGAIVENIPLANGYYDWDVTYLGSGDYRLYATLQDKVGSRVSPTGTQQYVGVEVSVAPWILRYVDRTAPPPLDSSQITRFAAEDGVQLCWPVSAASDLSDYRIGYMVRDSLYVTGRHVVERILPSVGYTSDGAARQCARLGGLIGSESEVSFSDYAADGLSSGDASGNTSTSVKPSNFTAPLGGVGDRLPAPTLTGTVNLSDDSLTLTWPITSGHHWQLFYAREAFAGVMQAGSGATEGDSPIMEDNVYFTGDYALHGLPRGYWHSFAVRAFRFSTNPYAPPSLLSNIVWLLPSNGVDANGNGCMDDWETAHNNPDLSADPDGDGLPTGQECAIGTNPFRRDTDGEGWSDGEEVYYGTDPLDPSSYPLITSETVTQTLPLPYLVVSPTQLSFIAFTQGPNSEPQMADVLNNGGGVLTPSVSADRAWLGASVRDGRATVSVDQAGLSPGTYTGTVTVRATPSNTQANPQTIQVTLRVLAGRPPATLYRVFLPVVVKGFGGDPTPIVVYDDALAPDWTASPWSYTSTVDMANTYPALGSASIAVTINGAHGGLGLRAGTAVPTAGRSSVTFSVYAPNTARSLGFYTQGEDVGGISNEVLFTAPANTWTPFTMTLSALGSPALIKRISIQDESEAAQPVLYVDNIQIR